MYVKFIVVLFIIKAIHIIIVLALFKNYNDGLI